MQLKIYTMSRTVFTGETSRVTLPTITGQLTLLENHIPLVTVLEPGTLVYVKNDKEETLPIKGGFLEVRSGNEVRVLADE